MLVSVIGKDDGELQKHYRLQRLQSLLLRPAIETEREETKEGRVAIIPEADIDFSQWAPRHHSGQSRANSKKACRRWTDLTQLIRISFQNIYGWLRILWLSDV